MPQLDQKHTAEMQETQSRHLSYLSLKDNDKQNPVNREIGISKEDYADSAYEIGLSSSNCS